MSDPKKQPKDKAGKEVTIEDLEIEKETLQDLTAADSEGVKGGMIMRVTVLYCPAQSVGCGTAQ